MSTPSEKAWAIAQFQQWANEDAAEKRGIADAVVHKQCKCLDCTLRHYSFIAAEARA